MTLWKRLAAYLPAVWIAALEALPLPQQRQVQELRLRGGEPLVLSTAAGLRYLCAGGLTALRQPDVFWCSRAQLARCVSLLCDESVYAHQEELRQGYIALPGGIRAGVAGRAVTQGVHIRSVQDITALCIRLPRRHRGCAAGVLPWLEEQGRLHSGVLVGEPASGKTSLLRDLAASLAGRHYRVAVVDERGELAGVDGLPGCEVLQGYPKAAGICQAVRCLAPQVVLFDELGEDEEVEAVAACAHAGVAVVTSLHGDSMARLACRPAARLLMRRQMFSRWLFLAGRENPSVVRHCLCPEVMGDAIHWAPVDRSGGCGAGSACFPVLVPAGGYAGTAGEGAGGSAAADDLYRSAYERTLAAAGAER